VSFLNLGKKDEYGRQRRIEHRGRYLRASRTGGVALRAQARAAGMNITANTSRGFRVSGTPAKNTQVAMQNGRFILRGRYGRGPTKMNLSKTGVTFSTRNKLGSFNWMKPKRSSAKIAGVQVRGQNAAILQSIYMLFMAVGMALKMVFSMLVMLFHLSVALFRFLYHLALAMPYGMGVVRRRWRNYRIARRLPRLESLLDPPMKKWDEPELVAGLWLVFGAIGRGKQPGDTAEDFSAAIESDTKAPGWLRQAAPIMPEVAAILDAVRQPDEKSQADDPRVLSALLAQCMTQRMSSGHVTEAILLCDEFSLGDGPRTVLQDQLLEVLGDFSGMRFQDPDEDLVQVAHAQPQQPESPSHPVNLNTASLDELEAVPHLGPERARALIAMRPINQLKELTAIDGIGPKRLREIQAFGVEW